MIILFSALLLTLVDGHGMMTSPRSRNWLATPEEKGVNSPEVGKPPAEYCEHCLNMNDPTRGSCGSANGSHDYNDWLDSTGQAMPFTPQEEYVEGDVITVSSYMATHHNGHIEIRYCDLGASGGIFTPDCFDGNYLTFVEDAGVYAGKFIDPVLKVDLFQKMPVDENYPERGYLSGGQNEGTGYTFVMKFQLPIGLVGEEILLQWKYITANSCSPEGYPQYFAANNLPDSYWTPGLHNKMCATQCYLDGDCISAFNEDGARSGYEPYTPEQFFNCGEVKILPADPNSSTTTVATTTGSSTTSTSSNGTTTTTAVGTGCCTIDFKSCSPTVQGYCSESESNCVGPCDKWWLPNGAVVGCTARFETCANSSECCSPGVCVDGYCSDPSDTTTSTSSSTVSSSTTSGSVSRQEGVNELLCPFLLRSLIFALFMLYTSSRLPAQLRHHLSTTQENARMTPKYSRPPLH
jgi:hypothetical protein